MLLYIGLKLSPLTTINLDKKNENKEVAVDEFLPSATAFEAIKNSL